MSPNIRSRRLALGLAASLGLLGPALGRGDTVDASSTTILVAREQARAGTLYRVAPLYEILSISARGIDNTLVDDLQLVFSGWAADSLGKNLVWYDRNAPRDRLFGDFDLAYIQGEVGRRRLQFRLGRQLVAGGVVGALAVDGASALVRLPHGLGFSAFLGSPVAQRLDLRVGETTFNAQRGDLAVGGRASWALPPWGEVGASWVDVEDGGNPSRRQVGGDLRLQPLRPLTVLASTSYDLYESRWAETSLVGQAQLLPLLLVSADFRHVEPDLLLARDSILAVFAVDRRSELGGGFQVGPWRRVTLDGDGHWLKQEGGQGHRVRLRATWLSARGTTLGAEVSDLRALGNGYFSARAFASRRVGRFTGTLDLQEYAFDHPVNGQKNSFLATATLARVLGRGFTALVSGSGGATPYYEKRFDFLAKLAYNQSYHLREVR